MGLQSHDFEVAELALAIGEIDGPGTRMDAATPAFAHTRPRAFGPARLRARLKRPHASLPSQRLTRRDCGVATREEKSKRMRVGAWGTFGEEREEGLRSVVAIDFDQIWIRELGGGRDDGFIQGDVLAVALP